MDMRRLVGQNVRRIREKRGLTQEQFADFQGSASNTSAAWREAAPTVVTVYELAVALGVSHLDLLRPTKKSAIQRA